MKFIKIRSIEILTNGCLNFSNANLFKLNQIKINEKDYNTLIVSQKQQKTLNKKSFETIYKHRFIRN